MSQPRHDILIREECPADQQAIYEITQAAFASAEHRSGTEGAIVNG